jgi:hypothetical protein
MYCVPGSSPSLLNCTLTGNGGDAIVCLDASPVLINCIVWHHLSSILAVGDRRPRVTYSAIEGESRAGEGNSNEDPLLACPGSYRLRAGSPAIDAGTAEGAPAVDIDGRPRPVGLGVDIGASEFSPGERAPVCFRRGEVNGDGAVNLSDALSILDFLFLGSERPPCAKSADLQDDGRVNVADPIALLGFLFLGGPLPAAPARRCGVDPTPDGLTCEDPVCS